MGDDRQEPGISIGFQGVPILFTPAVLFELGLVPKLLTFDDEIGVQVLGFE